MPDHRLAFDMAWPPPPRTRTRLRGLLKSTLIGGLPHWAPEAAVSGKEFARALKVLDTQDIGRSVEAFTGLGYEVTVRAVH